MNELLLEVKNLKTYFHTDNEPIKAVNDISLTIRRGETVAIVGESGSGKSVTSLSLMRLIQHPGFIDSGEIIFHSPKLGKIDIRALSRQEMQLIRGNEIAMIFQEPMTSLNPVLTCGNQVVETIRIHQRVNRKKAKQLALELFTKVKLDNPKIIFDAYPHQLSGGQKQRVMIAMALCCSPSLLIADEPTTALDVTVQASVLSLLNELKNDQMSIIFISHDLDVVAQLADRIIVMYGGKIVEEGTIWDVFSNPKHPYTKGLLACRPRIDLKLKILPVITDFVTMDEENKINFIQEDKQKYSSVGEAILLNVETEEEIRKKQNELCSQEPLLSVKNITVCLQDRKLFATKKTYSTIINDVSFDVYPGETLGLVGESGCGKSTLSKAILQLIPLNNGSILFEKNDISTYDKEELKMFRKNVQIIFQDPYSSLNPRMRIGEAIIEPMLSYNLYDSYQKRKEYTVELLEKVGLKPDYIDRYPHEFSGGQRQRICIARTLAIHPKFIICDESVSALDTSVQAQVLNLLNSLKRDFNFTYIFISHNLSVIRFMADRIIVMNKGKIEEVGYPDQIFYHPQQEYTKKLISSIPKADLETLERKIHLKKNNS